MDILVQLKFEEKSGSLQSQCMKGFGVTHKCDHKSLHMENFTLHMQASHDNIRYLCDQCDFKATCKGNLKVLGDSIHKGVQYL